MYTLRKTRAVTLVSSVLAASLFFSPAYATEAGQNQGAGNSPCVSQKDGFTWDDCGNDAEEIQQVPGAAPMGQASKNAPIGDSPWSLSDLFGPSQEPGAFPGDEAGGGEGGGGGGGRR